MFRAIGEIALRLDDEEARRHPDLEPPLLGVEPLLRQLAAELRGLDPLAVLLEPQRRVAHFAHGAPAPMLRSRAAAWSRSIRARARFASSALLPSG